MILSNGMMVRALFVSVTNNSGQAGNNGNPLNDADVARGFWHIRQLARANACQILVAVDKGRIVGVWNIDQTVGWQLGTPTAIPNRPFNLGDSNRYYCVLSGVCQQAVGVVGHRMAHVTGGQTMRGPIRYL